MVIQKNNYSLNLVTNYPLIILLQNWNFLLVGFLGLLFFSCFFKIFPLNTPQEQCQHYLIQILRYSKLSFNIYTKNEREP